MTRSAAWVRTDSNLSTYRLKLKYYLHLRTKRKGTKRPDTDAKILKVNKHKKSDKIELVFVSHLIGKESGASYLDQSWKVMKNNTAILRLFLHETENCSGIRTGLQALSAI